MFLTPRSPIFRLASGYRGVSPGWGRDYRMDSPKIERQILCLETRRRQFTSSRSRSSRASVSMVRIFSAAGCGTSGTDIASSQESSMAVRVSLN